jgi:hypothetical protein
MAQIELSPSLSVGLTRKVQGFFFPAFLWQITKKVTGRTGTTRNRENFTTRLSRRSIYFFLEFLFYLFFIG